MLINRRFSPSFVPIFSKRLPGRQGNSCIQSGLMCRLKLINLFLAVHRPPVGTLTDVDFGVEQTDAQIKSGLSKALTPAPSTPDVKCEQKAECKGSEGLPSKTDSVHLLPTLSLRLFSARCVKPLFPVSTC